MNYTIIGTPPAWKETFVIFPKITISGKRIFWQKAYTRRVWTVYGDLRFHLEPERQYATIFDVLSEDN